MRPLRRLCFLERMHDRSDDFHAFIQFLFQIRRPIFLLFLVLFVLLLEFFCLKTTAVAPTVKPANTVIQIGPHRHLLSFNFMGLQKFSRVSTMTILFPTSHLLLA